ncbi:ATP-binding protein [Streptomyces sp. CAS3]
MTSVESGGELGTLPWSTGPQYEERQQTQEGQAYLFGRLALLERRIQRAVLSHPDASESSPTALLEQMYVSQDEVLRLLHEPTLPLIGPEEDEQMLMEDLEADADEAAAAGDRIPLRDLAHAFSLTPHDLDMLMMALAPHLDSRFERFYSYLNQCTDVCQPTVGTVLRLTGQPAADGAARSRIITGPASHYRLWAVGGDGGRPLLTRPLHVADRVVAHVLGQDDLDSRIEPLVTRSATPLTMTTPMRQHATHIREALFHQQVVYIQEPEGDSIATFTADGALQALTQEQPLVIDLRLLNGEPDATALLTSVVREARLRSCGLRAGPVEAIAAHAQEHLARLVALCAPRTPLVLTGTIAWQPQWSPGPVYQMDPPPWTARERADVWRKCLANAALEDRDGLVQTMAPYSLGPDEIAKAAQSAHMHAVITQEPVTAPLLKAAACRQYAGGLERLARHVKPSATWDDLAVPTSVLTQLHDLAHRARCREQVLETWRMRPGDGRGHGVCALFTGESGTGKTLAAEVIATEAGLDLYVINLATVVDKYIGETEKNLERLFAAAQHANAILFFDEADAIFGKRSEVKDAHDRYANLETAYLLQQMEQYNGVAVLATNHFANIDQAFTRRLDTITHFPKPNEDLRRALWDLCLGPDLPRSDNLNLDHLAQTFELNGGDIRCCATTAAYKAAASGQLVTMDTLLDAVRHEYAKLGRLIDEDKFKISLI